ncbi:TetR/AcrR family transcriptional regulator [Bordetella sp. 2513F-2]
MTVDTKPKTRRTQADRSSAARAALVEAAVVLLSEEGFGRTTTAAIAKRARVTTGALHHHFPTKESLFIAVLDQLAVEALQLFSMLTDKGKKPQQAAALLVDTLWALYGSKRYWAVWEINMGFRHDEAMHAKIVEHRLSTRAAMEQAIQSNPLLRETTRKALFARMNFILSAMRGIFLDTFFAGHENRRLDQQLDVLKQELAWELSKEHDA